jgi:UDPglucose 6-dehydrogenase
VVYNPEFLVEGSSKQDFVDPKLHVFGGTEWATDMLARLYLKNSICTWCPIFAMTMDEAALVKYAINSFLALKVIFFNELYDTARHIDANFGVISDAIGSDPRIGHSHTKVPGFDGKRGFGGSCFPKDTQAFISYSRAQQLLRKCVEINSEYHRKYDDISGSLEPELDD